MIDNLETKKEERERETWDYGYKGANFNYLLNSVRLFTELEPSLICTGWVP